MHSIGVISDTHGLLREEVGKELRHYEIILHGVDVDGILNRIYHK